MPIIADARPPARSKLPRSRIHAEGGVGRRFLAAGLLIPALIGLATSGACAGSISIMPLGDSITSGLDGNYRYRLGDKLGPGFDFIGTSRSNPGEIPGNWDQDHEGHPGYTINKIIVALDGASAEASANRGFWMTGNAGNPDLDRGPAYPDVILLHAGTNDMEGVQSGGETGRAHEVANSLTQLIEKLVTLRPQAHIIVASIIPNNTYYQPLEDAANQYNALIPGIVESYRSAGKYLSFLDMHSKLTTSDLADFFHPNQGGFDKMADAWHEALLVLDDDRDGLPDLWELKNWGTTDGHSASDDADHDGVIELYEYAFDRNPTESDAAPVPVVLEDGHLTVTLAKRPGIVWRVETSHSPNPDDFTSATTTTIVDTAETLTVRDNESLTTSSARYLRVQVSPL